MPEKSRIEYKSEQNSYSGINHGASFVIGQYVTFTDAEFVPDNKLIENAEISFRKNGSDT